MTPKRNTEVGNPMDPELAKLHQASERRAGEVSDEFPPAWDPKADGHPNPITTAAFPPLQKPVNASSPLVELEHIDGKRYTLWLSDSLLKALLRAEVKEGSPVSIHRSLEKRPYHNEKLGRDVDAWQWTVTTPTNQHLPVRGGQVLSIDQLRREVVLPGERAEEIAPGAAARGGELEPDPETTEAVWAAEAESDDIPF